MPYAVVDPALWRKQISRVLISGSPNAGKTTSFRTWPGPLTVIGAPMEKGLASIPRKTLDGKDVKALTYTMPDASAKPDWRQVAADFRGAVFTEAKVEGTRGIAVDGLHHLHRVFLNEVTFGAASDGGDFDTKLFGNAHAKFFTFLDQLQKLGVDYVVATVWDGLEKDNPDDVSAKAPRHVFPDLPGGAAKRIMGEWSCSFYATKEGANYIWVTKPRGAVWGASTKLPIDIAAKIPETVPQDWAKFEANVMRVAEGGEWVK